MSSELPISALKPAKEPVELLRNSSDLATSLLVGDLRMVLKDDRAKDPAWVVAKFRTLLKAVTGEDL